MLHSYCAPVSSHTFILLHTQVSTLCYTCVTRHMPQCTLAAPNQDHDYPSSCHSTHHFHESYYTCRCSIMRGGMEQYLTPMGPTKLHVNPIFEISPLEPRFSEWLVFEGLSIDEHGRQHFLDASVAYKRAVLNCIHYLSKFGYTKQQVGFC